MTTIYLVRHGQASFGAANYDQLSPLGERQGALLGRWWRQTGVAAPSVVVGAMQRHLQTARACLAELGQTALADEALVDPGFNEYDHEAILRIYRPDLGDHASVRRYLIGQAEQGIDPKHAFQRVFMQAVNRWTSGQHDADYAESWVGFQQRCSAAVRRAAALTQERGHDSVAVFTSGGPIMAITQDVMGVPDERAFDLAWSLHNAGVTRLKARPSGLRLGGFNDVAHLDITRDPSTLTYR
ncbi:histidine phosphatase family protein [Aquabacterium sp.]|uniref:histidine phosphatase family protein n=1 Tax=Aquabacterium sp. TaxID=1872578 RepID=UPI0035ADEAB7